jgi:hypothetical protein
MPILPYSLFILTQQKITSLLSTPDFMLIKGFEGFGTGELEAGVLDFNGIDKPLVNCLGSLMQSLVNGKAGGNNYQFREAVLVAGDSPLTMAKQCFEGAVKVVVETLSLFSDGS